MMKLLYFFALVGLAAGLQTHRADPPKPQVLIRLQGPQVTAPTPGCNTDPQFANQCANKEVGTPCYHYPTDYFPAGTTTMNNGKGMKGRCNVAKLCCIDGDTGKTPPTPAERLP